MLPSHPPQLRRLRNSSRLPSTYFSQKNCVYIVAFIFVCMIGNQYYLLYTFQTQYDHDENNILVSPNVLQEHYKGSSYHHLQRKNDFHVTSTVKQDGISSSNHSVGDVSEEAAFSNILERVKRSKATCHKIEESTYDNKDLRVRTASTDVEFLPEFGVSDAVEKAMNDKSVPSWGQCKLPPTKSCELDKVSVILMAYNEEGLKNIVTSLSCCTDSTLYPRRIIDELILVWNGPDRESLESTRFGEALKNQIESGQLPMRFFISTEHGLENNLLNRYHPLVNPRNEAVLFFDDDGPYFFKHTVEAGFELWKRNSGRQVGCMARHFETKGVNAKRQHTEHRNAVDISIKEMISGKQTEPYDIDNITQQPFIPHCKSAGDDLRYNFNDFYNFHAQMILPSGSYLHRNFLCFIWHPAFQELRDYVLAHPTHPDDITVSMIVSHITGRAPRVYTRRMHKRNAKKILDDGTIVDVKDDTVTPVVMLPPKDIETTRRLSIVEESKESNEIEEYENYARESFQRSYNKIDEPRRRLLWNEQEWAGFREDALNSIASYFGSFNGGSVGWCLTTQFHVEQNGLHWCDPVISGLDWAPWLNEGKLGYDECPITPYALEFSDEEREKLLAKTS